MRANNNPLIRLLLALMLAVIMTVLVTWQVSAGDAPPAPEQPAAPPAPPEVVTQGESGGDAPPAEEAAMGAAPLSAQGDLGILGVSVWFYCSGGSGGKCEGYGTVTGALADFNALGGSGAIYVTAGEMTEASPILVDGGYTKLTGLIGAGGGEYVSGLVATSTIDGTIEVQSRPSFTIQGFEITHDTGTLVNFYDTSGTITLKDLYIHGSSGYGLNINGHNGLVNISGVRVTDTTGAVGNGAARIEASGNVSISNSSFDVNTSVGGYNLTIETEGSAVLNGVTASNGAALTAGARIIAQKGSTIKNASFNGNPGHTNSPPGLSGYVGGLVIDPASAGAVLLENVSALANGQSGIKIQVHDSAITLKNVSVLGGGVSSSDGILLNNCIESGGACTATAPAGISLTGVSSSLNDGYGIRVISNGNIQADNLTAVENGGMGIELDNSGALTVRTIKVLNSKGASTASDNDGSGMQIKSRGAVTVTGLTVIGNSKTIASDNTINNCNIDSGVCTNSASVTIKNSTFSENGVLGVTMAKGLVLTSGGAVSLTNVTVQGNSNSGMEISNLDASSPKNVSITKSVFDENNAGLTITSRGAVTLNQVGASGNRVYSGIEVNNSGGTGGVTISASGSNWNTFNNNKIYGLSITTHGNVSLTSVQANGNQHNGLMVRNDVTAASLTLKNIQASENDRYGIWTYGNGAITASGVVANGNNQISVVGENYGVWFNNCWHNGTICDATALAKNVSLTNFGAVTNQFSNGNKGGLWVTTLGAVTLNKLDASNSGNTQAYGVKVNVGGVGNVSVSNATAHNNGVGVSITTQGSVVVKFTSADGNDYQGIDIDNEGVAGAKTVTLQTVTANRSLSASGITIDSLGAVSLTGVTANYSIEHGLDVETDGKVTISSSTFDSNDRNGMRLTAGGVVAISKTLVRGNGMNAVCSATGGCDGIFIDTSANHTAVTITSSTIQGNGRHGIYVDIIDATVPFTIKSSYFLGNDLYADGTPHANIRTTGLLVIQ